MISKAVLYLFAALMLVGCDQSAWFEFFLPQEEVEFSKNYLALIQARDFDTLEATIDSSLMTSKFRAQLEQLAAFFPTEKPTDVQTVGVHEFSNAGRSQVLLKFQYEFPGKWLLANVFLQKRGDTTVVTGVNFQPLRDSLENTNRFTFDGKEFNHFVVLSFSVIIPLFILAAIILCFNTPIPERKWLWVLFILVGFVPMTMNWTDGNLQINPLSFQILGAGFWKTNPFGPLLLTVSVPIGAIVFFLRRRQWLIHTHDV